MRPDVYRNILAGIAMGSLVSCATPKDISTQASPTDKGPGEITLYTSSPSSSIVFETPRPGWSEHTSVVKFNKVKFRFELRHEWSFRDEDQELVAESPPTRDLTQMATISIFTRRSPLSSDSFAEQFAGFVDDKTKRSPFEYTFAGKKVMSYLRVNPITGQEEHIFGFVVDGVGIGIKMSAIK